MPEPDLRLLLRLILALVLALVTWYGLRYPYSCLVTSGGAQILSSLSGMPPEEIVRVHDGEFYLNTGLIDAKGRPTPLIKMPINQVHWNSIILLSLVYLAPWRLWRRCWWYLLVAFFLLFLSHVAFFTLNVLGTVAAKFRAAGIRFPEGMFIDLNSDALVRTMAIAVQTYSLIFEKAVPFLLFVPVALAWRRPPAPVIPARTGGVVGRNDRCPCGSGKKYKHCCLR